jgi:hypothetical protein
MTRAPEDPTVQVLVGLIRVREGRSFPLQPWIQKYRKTYESDGGYCAAVAAVFAGVHENAEAMRWLRRATALSFKHYRYLAVDPLFDNLRMDPDFQSLLETLRVEWEKAKQVEARDRLLPATTP